MDNEYLKRIYGLLESGATLGTGAVSGLVGLPYGLYRGVTSGAYGTPEAPRIAAREAQQFMERNTYQPRSAEGQENLRQIAGLLEASKLPPVMPEASLLAAIPKQAYAAQAERAGMAAERAIEPVVTRTMERGGLPAQLLGDLSQGSMVRVAPEAKIIAESAPAKTGLLSNEFAKDYYDLNAMATQAYSDYRANPTQELGERYKAIMKARDEAPNNPSNNYTPPVADVVPESYKGEHTAPMKDSGAPLWNLKDIYPDDFYSYQGARFYGDGAEPARDSMIVSQMQGMKGRPDKQVTIYRAVPKSVPTKEALNTGDWVTLDRKYAKEHGEGALNGDYKIVKKTVKARDLFTNGDSIYEMGYDPQPFIPKRDLGLLD